VISFEKLPTQGHLTHASSQPAELSIDAVALDQPMEAIPTPTAALVAFYVEHVTRSRKMMAPSRGIDGRLHVFSAQVSETGRWNMSKLACKRFTTG
jgi:hypothetical protein